MVEHGENKDGQHTLIVTYLYEAPREERTVWTVGPLTPVPPKPLHIAGRREQRDGRGCWVMVVVVVVVVGGRGRGRGEKLKLVAYNLAVVAPVSYSTSALSAVFISVLQNKDGAM